MKIIRKTYANVFVGLFLFACLVLSMTFAASAASSSVSAKITVTQDFQVKGGHTPSAGEKVSYKFTSLDSSYPMPSGIDSDGALEFTLNGDSSRDISIEYASAGVYHYKLTPVLGKVYDNYSYEKTVYTIDVYVENGENGLEPTVVVFNGSKLKCDNITYTHSYKAESVTKKITHKSFSSTPKTGDESNIALWGCMIAASAAVIVLALYKKSRKAE